MKKLSAILAFVLVLLTFTACGSAGYEKTIENYYKAILKEDAEARDHQALCGTGTAARAGRV